MFEEHPVPMWVYSETDKRILEVNKAAVKRYLYDREHFLQLTLEDIRPSSERQTFAAIPAQCDVNSFTDRGIWKHCDKNGRHLLAHIRAISVVFNHEAARLVIAEPVSDDNGLMERLSKISNDMLNIRNAVTTSSIVSVTDKTGRITYANQNFEEVSGYTQEELLGKDHRVINFGHHPKSFWVNMWKTVSKGQYWREEVKNKAKDGSYYWVDTWIIPMLDTEQRITEYISIRNIITEKKEAENRIHEIRSRLEAFFNSSNELGVLISPEGNIIAFNKKADETVRQLYRRRIEEGQPFSAYCSPELVSLAEDIMPQILAGKRYPSIHFSKSYKNGRILHWKFNFMPARDSEGKIIAVAFTGEDITELKIAESRNALQYERLKDIAWKQSHLMRAPLANLKGLMQIRENCTTEEWNLMMCDELNKLDKVIVEMVQEASDLSNEPTDELPVQLLRTA